MKIIGYFILKRDAPNDLSEDVNNLIAEGWQPHDCPFSVGNNYGFCQAMVKYGEQENE